MKKCAGVVGGGGGVFIVVIREKFAEGKQRLLAYLILQGRKTFFNEKELH